MIRFNDRLICRQSANFSILGFSSAVGGVFIDVNFVHNADDDRIDR